MENKEWSAEELRLRAESYCASAERCEQDVQLKLRQWMGNKPETENEQDICSDIITHLYKAGFMDNKRYCRAFVHDKLAYQHWGRMKIQYMLHAKKLPEAAISTAMDELDENEYQKVLEHTAEQFIRLNRKKYTANPDCLYRFLAQRGFTPQEIRHFLQK